MSYGAGEPEIYLTRFPGGEGRWQVTVEGGWWPRWRGDGRTLFFALGDGIFEVPVSAGPDLRVGTPRPLFTRQPLSRSGRVEGFDVSADGQRFLVVEPEGPVSAERSAVVVLNWAPEIGPGE